MKSKKTRIEIATPDEVEQYASGAAATPPADGAAPTPNDAPAPLPAGAPEPSAEGGAAPVDERAAQAAEAEQWKDRCLRARAELENFRRRSEQERAESLKYAIAAFARSLLSVLDDFERMLEHLGTQGADGDSVAEAIRLTYDNLRKALAEHHVEPIEAQGRPFDPAWHEAMMQQPSAEYDEPTVLQEVQKGYKLFDRVLRPSKVIVSKPVDAASPDSASEPEGA